LHKLKAETDSPHVFATERGGPFTTDAVNRLIKRIGARAGLPFPGPRPYAAPRLRLRSIQHTARYTELSQQGFKDSWRD
jgi:hypothetical protein